MVFNVQWMDAIQHPSWASWLRSVEKDPHKARCCLCSKTFDLSNMGIFCLY